MVYNIESLAKAAGSTRRAVRYYIQRGLLPPPEGKLRGAYYTEAHLERLRKIRALSESGVPLALMKDFLDSKKGAEAVSDACLFSNDSLGEPGMTGSKSSGAPSAEFVEWRRFSPRDGVELNVRVDVLSEAQIRRLIAAVRESIAEMRNEK